MPFIPLILGIVTAVSGYLGYQALQPEETQPLGAFSDPFLSIQLAPSPSDGYVLYSDGTDNYWDTATAGSGGSGLFEYDSATDTITPILASTSNTALLQMTAFIASSTATSSVFVNASTTNLTVSGNLWGNLTGNADTATALAANGANCASGNSPLGVDASGAVESCFDVWTEAENTAAGYGTGSVTSVAATVPTGWTISGTPITTAGTLAFGYDTGYAAVLTASTSEWATAYGWGDHSTQGYLTTVASSSLSISNWTNGYVLQASTTASGGFDWVATSTLGITEGEWTDAGTSLYPTETSDQVVIGSNTPVALSSLTVVATSSDTSHILTVQSDALDELFYVDNNYSVNINSDLNILSGWDVYLGNGQTFTWGDGSVRVAGNASNEDMYFHTSNAIRATIDDTGLGIGTTSPEAELDVWGDSGSKIITLFSDTGSKFMEMLNTGVTTLLGAWDFGGATSFELPNGSNPTVNATGEIALSTSTNALSVATSTSALELPLYPPMAFQYASSSWTSTSTVQYPTLSNFGEVITSGICNADGTGKIRVGDGTNYSNLVSLSSGTTTVSFTSNNKFNSGGELVKIEIGTPTTLTTVSCKFERYYTR